MTTFKASDHDLHDPDGTHRLPVDVSAAREARNGRRLAEHLATHEMVEATIERLAQERVQA